MRGSRFAARGRGPPVWLRSSSGHDTVPFAGRVLHEEKLDHEVEHVNFEILCIEIDGKVQKDQRAQETPLAARATHA